MDSVSQPPIFISGATGYVASHIIKLLLEQGHKVRGSVRSLSNTAKNQFLYDLVPDKKANLELVEAELTDAKSWIPALSSCQYVLHVASPIPPYVTKDENEIIKPAVEGTLNVLNAALINKCKKVVVTSSCLAIAAGNQGKLCTEEDWADLSKISHYPKSKVLAEKATWEFYEKHKTEIQVAVVNPSLILGPGLSVHGNSSEKLIAELISGNFPAIPDFQIGFKVVDVRDVAVGEIKALFEEAANGKRYALTSEGNLFFADLVKILKEEFGKYGYKLPEKIATKEEIIQSGNGVAIRTVGLGPMVMEVSNERSVKELAMKYRNFQESLIEMGYALIKNGVVEKKF